MPSFPGGLGLVIGCPHRGHQVVLEWAYSIAQLHPPMNFEVRWISLRNMPVDEARNTIIEQAIQQKAKYVFFIDDDVVVPPHGLRQLIYHLDHSPKYAVAGAVYCHKSPPQAPMVFRGNGLGPFWDWHIGEVFDVSGIGMGATLIRVEALLGNEDHKPLVRPFFQTIDSVEKYKDGIAHAEMWTEDLYFCKKLENEGWGIMADGGLLCRHFDLSTGVGYSLPEGSKPTLLPVAPEKGKKSIIDLGCGTPDESMKTTEGEVLRVDAREDVHPDYRCNIAANLPWPTQSFDIVFSSHTLEHFSRTEVPGVLTEWCRLVKDDGEIRMILPNIEWAARHILNGEIDMNVMNVLYGAQSYDLNFHKTGFTPQIIEQLLKTNGFKKFVWDFHNYHMFVRAWKNADAVENPIVRLVKIPVPNAQAQLGYENTVPKQQEGNTNEANIRTSNLKLIDKLKPVGTSSHTAKGIRSTSGNGRHEARRKLGLLSSRHKRKSVR